MSELKDSGSYIKEIINEKAYYMSFGTSIHARVSARLSHKFDNYFMKKNKACETISEGLEVFLDGKGSDNCVMPDVVVVCDKSKFSIRGYEGAPELIIEVISPATAKKDKEEKLNSYEKAGVLEYWIVNTKDESIEQRILIDGRYKLENVLFKIDDVDYGKLTDEQKKNYSTKIQPFIFEDLEFDLEDIFSF